jgi:ABC-2 type transport system permease protein
MNKIITILKKEWVEVFKNRMVLFSVIFLPLMLTAIPLVILFTMRGDSAAMQSADMPEQVNALCPPEVSGGECFQIYMVSQFMLMFMILPLVIPPPSRPIRSWVRKPAAHWNRCWLHRSPRWSCWRQRAWRLLPAMLATYAAFGIFALGARLMISNPAMYTAILDIRWLAAVFLVGPLLALVSVNFSVIISSRVNDPRVAEQLTALLIVPLLAVFFGQMAGLFI